MSDGRTFDASWREMLLRQGDLLDVVAAVIRLTGGGAHPVRIGALSAAVDRPVDEIRRLVEQADAGLRSLRTGHDGDRVWLDLASADRARFWYEIGDRRIGVGGCGPDIFEVARALDGPMRVAATCPITGAAVSLDFARHGVRTVRPADTVVAAVHLGTVAEAAVLADAARVDADVCTQQTFFANRQVARAWLDRHPGGRVFAVADFDEWWRHLRRGAS